MKKIMVTAYLWFLPVAAFAETSATIIKTGGITDVVSLEKEGTGFAGYLTTAHAVGVAAVAAIAVVMIVWGAIGIFGENVWGKTKGKERVQNAILGLLLAAGSYVILKTISDSLVSADFTLDSSLGADGTTGATLVSSGTTGSVGSATSNNYPTTGTVTGDSNYSGTASGDTNSNVGQTNNNYGNIKSGGSDLWQGSTGYDSQGHAIFENAEYGTRAYMLNLANQYESDKFNSVSDLISYYTATTGDQAEYISYIEKETGFNSNADLNLVSSDGTVNKSVLYPLTNAMFKFESNITVDNTHLDNAYNLAFGSN